MVIESATGRVNPREMADNSLKKIEHKSSQDVYTHPVSTFHFSTFLLFIYGDIGDPLSRRFLGTYSVSIQ